MDLGLKNRVAVVMAASQGLGKASAMSLAAEGCKIAICSRDLKNIKKSAAEIKEITAAEGKGPVSALDNALRKALNKFFLVDLERMHLVDFKVRVIEGREGTSARVKVFIDSRDQERVWSTIGVSTDIIEASWQALEDSFEYKLSRA